MNDRPPVPVPVCSTVVDDLLEAQLAGPAVCSTVVDDLLEAQLDGAPALRPRGAGAPDESQPG